MPKHLKAKMAACSIAITMLAAFLQLIAGDCVLIYGIKADDASVGSGTADFPYIVDANKNGCEYIDGNTLLEIKNKNQYVIFESENASVEYSGIRIYEPDSSAQYSTLITVYDKDGAVYIEFEEKKALDAVVTIKAYVGEYFENACILNIEYAGGCDEVDANYEYMQNASVVDNGWITFDASCGGIYRADYATDEDGSPLNVEKITSYSISEVYNNYKGTENGSAEYPLTMIAKLKNFADFNSTWKFWNDVAGYSGDDFPEYSSYNPENVKHILIEDRDADTGHLKASIQVDGNKWDLTTESEKGPYQVSFTINPDEKTIKNALKLHATYRNDKVKYYNANKLLNLYSESELTNLFFITRTRNFEGPITYKIDVSEYFEPGDAVNIQYVLGSSNRNFYHSSIKPDLAELILEEPTYSKYDKIVNVDYEGYITLDFYTGGFFTFTKDGVMRPELSDDELMQYETETDLSGETQTGEGITDKISDSSDASGDADSDSSSDLEGMETQTIPVSTDADMALSGTDPADVNGYEDNGSMPENPLEAELETTDNLLVQDDGNQIDADILYNEIDEEDDENNLLKIASEDGKISAKGRVSGNPAYIRYSMDNDDLDSAFGEQLSDGLSACEYYDIAFMNDDSTEYTMSGDDYFKVTVKLSGGYSIFDVQNLSVRKIRNGNELSGEILNSEAALDADGKMLIAFYTTSSGGVLIAKNADETDADTMNVRADANTPEAASLAKSKSDMPDSKIPFGALAGTTVAALSAGQLIRTVRKRSIRT